MSGGQACKCAERSEHLTMSREGDRPARLWRVLQRLCNHSSFNGYRYEPSIYSTVCCLRCGAHWRTKSSYVDQLRDAMPHELNIAPGTAAYGQTMIDFERDPL